MALTLDPTLAAAQNNASRRPVVEIRSLGWVADIPFDGQFLTTETENETAPNAITLASGRIATTDILGGDTIVYTYTDEARTEFFSVSFAQSITTVVMSVSLVESADGNVGFLWMESYGGNYRLRRMVISPTGLVLQVVATIEQWATASYTLTDPWVIRLQSGTYLAVYGYGTGGVYGLRKRTSSDFLSWSAHSAISISGPSTAFRWDHPSLLQIDNGDVWLWFDHVDAVSGTAERTNIYYSVSSNDGATWSAATALTSYTTFSPVADHPEAVQKTTNTMHVAYTVKQGALHMYDTDAGWCEGSSGIGADDHVRRFTFDIPNGKLYVTPSYGNFFTSVVRIDLATWTIDACWSDLTTPALPEYTQISLVMYNLYKHKGDGHLIPIAVFGFQERLISLINGEDNTITTFYLDDNATYGYIKNTTGFSSVNYTYLVASQADAVNNRLWLLFSQASSSPYFVQVGYIDLTQTGPSYSFTPVVMDTSVLGGNNAQLTSQGDFLVVPGEDRIFVSMGHELNYPYPQFEGRLKVYNLTTGGIEKDYRYSTTPNMHSNGLRRIAYLNGVVYGDFLYRATDGQADRRGLCKIDLATDVITYHTPSWASVDDYGLWDMVTTEDDKIIIAAYGFGVTIYDPASDTWELINEAALPGMNPGTLPSFYERWTTVAYNPQTGMIAASHGSSGNIGGVNYFSRYGFLRRAYYQIGTGPSWSFAAQAPLVIGWQDYDAAITLDPADAIYAFWTNKDVLELSEKWDKEGAELDLSSFLVNGESIEAQWSIDGKPAQLSFSVSHGHLFDPTNLLSLLSIYLKKGRRLTLKFGENVGGTEYWANQGTFLVTETKLDFERGKYPTMSVQAEDQRTWWDDMQVVATQAYTSSFPEDIIKDVLVTHAGLINPGDFTLPVFANRVLIEHQWLDKSVAEIIEQVANRFGYFIRIAADGKVSARKISDANAVDHIYSDLTRLVDYSPDDSFSNFVNQVIVTGEEQTYIEVLFAEERVDQFAGTMGWWQGTEQHTRYYSIDKSKTARNPRLVALVSTSSIAMELAGKVYEHIVFVDPLEKYVIVEIVAPNLTFILLALIVGELVAMASIGDWAPTAGGMTVPVGKIMEAAILQAIFLILGSVANYQFEIWARPVGRIRRSLQAIADDLDHQNEIGRVVSQKIDDPLVFTVAQAQQVADFELLVVKMQRKRVSFTKIAHLQDEEGDTIRVPHPYTGQALPFFVTSLKRSFQKPSEPGGGGGHFLDTIEAWRV